MIAWIKRRLEERRHRRAWEPVEFFHPPARVETDSGEWVVFWRYRNGKLGGTPAAEYDRLRPGQVVAAKEAPGD